MPLRIRVDFFKPTGKWYAGAEVEVSLEPWEDDFLPHVLSRPEIPIRVTPDTPITGSS